MVALEHRARTGVGQHVDCSAQQSVVETALSAVLWPTRANADDDALQAAVDAANATLPDYARVARWTRGRADFDARTGLATANGRPLRNAIHQRHAGALGLALESTH